MDEEESVGGAGPGAAAGPGLRGELSRRSVLRMAGAAGLGALTAGLGRASTRRRPAADASEPRAPSAAAEPLPSPVHHISIPVGGEQRSAIAAGSGHNLVLLLHGFPATSYA